MLAQQLFRRLGNQHAIENARVASTYLSRRRVEREEVDLFLENLGLRWLGATEARPQAAASSTP